MDQNKIELLFQENGLKMTPRAKKAVELFEGGYNCAQSVFGAFADKIDLSFETMMALSSGFGGGIGRLREVCGAVSGGVFVLGYLFDKGVIPSVEEKAAGYERIQNFAKVFEKAFGSYLCRELLELPFKNDSPVPEARTPEYYFSRPCSLFVGLSAALIDRILEEEK